MLTILKTVVAQIDVLETMTRRQFLTFRDRLEAVSGFQSAQFRELEALLGRATRAPWSLRPRLGRSRPDSRGDGAPVGLRLVRPLAPIRGTRPRHRRWTATSPPTRALGAASTPRGDEGESVQRFASEWSTSTTASRHGATATSRWCAARSATNAVPAAWAARATTWRRRCCGPRPRSLGGPNGAVIAVAAALSGCAAPYALGLSCRGTSESDGTPDPLRALPWCPWVEFRGRSIAVKAGFRLGEDKRRSGQAPAGAPTPRGS
jgi:hypothetical protein